MLLGVSEPNGWDLPTLKSFSPSTNPSKPNPTRRTFQPRASLKSLQVELKTLEDGDRRICLEKMVKHHSFWSHPDRSTFVSTNSGLALDLPDSRLVGVVARSPARRLLNVYTLLGIVWMCGSCRSLSNSQGCARQSAFKLVGMLHASCGFFHDFPEGCTISECILDSLKLEHYRMFFWQHRPSTSMISSYFPCFLRHLWDSSRSGDHQGHQKVQPLPRIAQKWHEPSTILDPSGAAPWCRRHFPCVSLKLHVSGCRVFERRMVAEQMQQLPATWRFSWQFSWFGRFIRWVLGAYVYRRSLSHSYDTLAI